jgi:tetratricopeptide (TPR) repeat protein
VPGWHKATETLQREGKLQLVGIILEQQPERARLYMQWKQMSWPLMADPLNMLGLDIMPLVLGIDECGIIRETMPALEEAEEFLHRFVNHDYGPCTSAPPAKRIPNLATLKASTARGRAEDWRAYADSLVLWGKPSDLDEAISAYQQAIQRAPNDGWSHFRAGVAYRARYDSPFGQHEDFQRAQDEWSQALDIDPNNWLWRRRLQQYGPLKHLFGGLVLHYDWIPTARTEIAARGETPVPLKVEPSSGEMETATDVAPAVESVVTEPDPRGRVYRDRDEFIRAEITTSPRVVNAGTSARFHVVLRPILERKAFWNNEAEDLVLWVNPPQGWEVDRQYVTLPRPSKPETQEVREVEVEVKSPAGAKPGPVTIPSYALYYVCEDVNGVCMFRRQDLTLTVDVR